MPLQHRVLRAIREVAPYMLAAAVGCFLATACIGMGWVMGDRSFADRMVVGLGWGGFGGVWFVLAYISERYA